MPKVNVDDGGFTYSKCLMYDVNYTEILESGITEPDPTWPVTSCRHGWEYNFTDIPYETVATQVKIPMIMIHCLIAGRNKENPPKYLWHIN